MEGTAGPPEADLLVTGGDVLTMDSRRTVVPGGAVALRGGEIVGVGPLDEVRRAHPGVPEHDARGCLVLPGLVDAHQHCTVDPLLRGSIPDDLAPGEAVMAWAVPAHAAVAAGDDAVAALLTCVDALTNGVTTVVEAGTVAHPLEVADSMLAAGVRGTVGTWGWDAAGQPFAAPVAEVIERQGALLDAVPPGGRVSAMVSLVGHDLVSDELLVAAAELARHRSVMLTFHVSPDGRDAESYLRRTGQRPVVWFDRLGILGRHLLLAHAVHLDDDELDLLASSGTAVASCPWAYLRLGQGFTRAGRHARLAAAGGRVALGCDSHNAGDAIDVLRTAALFAGLAKDTAEDPTWFGAADALALATRTGADAVGLGRTCGSIEPGRRGDIVVVRPPRPRGDPYLDVVWGSDGRRVRDVFVDGRLVVADGRCLTVDVEALLAEAEDRRRALLARAGLPDRRPAGR